MTEIESGYLNPMDFGAKGNGIDDDTVALRKCLEKAQEAQNEQESLKTILIPSGKTFLVSQPLNKDNEAVVVNIVGYSFSKILRTSDKHEKRGRIQLKNGTSLFKGVTISGNISNIYVSGEDNDNFAAGEEKYEANRCFDHCHLVSLNIINSVFSNIGAFLYDSPLDSVCRIIGNTFFTCYWFARFVDDSDNKGAKMEMTDSIIEGNYINGGPDKNNNSCFEFGSYNGSTIVNNFIDYYRTIYHPKSPVKCSFTGPLSMGNQYQVFRYFYYFEEEVLCSASVCFTSIGDSFNHTSTKDGPAKDKLEGYASLSYRYKDKVGATRCLPPCIAYTRDIASINIVDAKIEHCVDTILFVKDSITQYEYSKFKLIVNERNVYQDNNIVVEEGASAYNGGNYRYRNKIETNLVRVVTELPAISEGWVNGLAAFGMKVLYNDMVLTASIYHSPDGWHCGWLDEWGNVVS